MLFQCVERLLRDLEAEQRVRTQLADLGFAGVVFDRAVLWRGSHEALAQLAQRVGQLEVLVLALQAEMTAEREDHRLVRAALFAAWQEDHKALHGLNGEFEPLPPEPPEPPPARSIADEDATETESMPVPLELQEQRYGISFKAGVDARLAGEGTRCGCGGFCDAGGPCPTPIRLRVINGGMAK